MGFSFKVLVFLFLASCTQAPTKGFESQPVSRHGPGKLSSKVSSLPPIEIKPETVVVDTRPHFIYSLSHLPGSINLSWQEFTETNLKHRGELVKDLFAKTRRLARLGISPDTPVVVVGDGKTGHGEEGRMAWTLKYLGIKKVDFVGKDYFDQARWVSGDGTESPKAAVPMWKPLLEKVLDVEKSEIKKFIVKKKELKPKDSSQVLEGEIGKESPSSAVVIDCRPTKDYASGAGVAFSPEVRVVNISWTEFIDDTGRPDPKIAEKLKGIQISPEQRIFVLSDNGLESGTVVMALSALGFQLTGHVAGGYGEILR